MNIFFAKLKISFDPNRFFCMLLSAKKMNVVA